jgi:polyhydroxyalkanoate synthesis regulator protein
MRVIKYYRNRKLYDTEESRYTTLKEVIARVKDGETIQIINNKNKADITFQTLRSALNHLDIPATECIKLIKSHQLIEETA